MHQIYTVMQTGSQVGMQTMDAAVADLLRQGRISQLVASQAAHNAEDMRRLVEQWDAKAEPTSTSGAAPDGIQVRSFG